MMKLMVIEQTTAKNEIRERRPCIMSEKIPRMMLPKMAPRSITVERLATA
jgi:hypothetical protein